MEPDSQIPNQSPEMPKSNFWQKTWWARATKAQRITGLIILALAGSYLYYLGTQNLASETDTPSDSSTSTSSETSSSTTADTSNQTSNSPATTVLASGGLQVEQKSAFSCTADAPADWTISSNKESNSADLYSADRASYAGYGIQAINEQLAPYAGAYQAPLNNPDLYSSDPSTVVKAYVGIIASSLGEGSGAGYTNDTNETVGDFTLRSFSVGGHKGLVFYHTQGFPGDGYNYSYIEPFYVAMVPVSASEADLLLVARVAASISCSTQLVHHDGPLVKAQLSDHSSTGSDGNGSDPGYNVQLGTEYAHDSAGNNYLVDPSTNWSSTGPDGGGYYVPTSGGNSYEKLQAGRSD